MRKEILVLAVILLPLSASAQRVAMEQLLASLAPSDSDPVAVVEAERRLPQAKADKDGKEKAHP